MIQKSVYAVLTDFLPSGVIDALSQIKQDYELANPYGETRILPSLRGVVWNPHLKRSYPENSLASNILGFLFIHGSRKWNWLLWR